VSEYDVQLELNRAVEVIEFYANKDNYCESSTRVAKYSEFHSKATNYLKGKEARKRGMSNE